MANNSKSAKNAMLEKVKANPEEATRVIKYLLQQLQLIEYAQDHEEHKKIASHYGVDLYAQN